jgi:hypothetical protein
MPGPIQRHRVIAQPRMLSGHGVPFGNCARIRDRGTSAALFDADDLEEDDVDATSADASSDVSLDVFVDEFRDPPSIRAKVCANASGRIVSGSIDSSIAPPSASNSLTCRWQ